MPFHFSPAGSLTVYERSLLCLSCKHLLWCQDHHRQKAEEVTNNINPQHLNLTSATVLQSLLSKSSLFKTAWYVFSVTPLKEMLLVSSL